MQPLGTKVYLLKSYSSSEAFVPFFLRVWKCLILHSNKVLLKAKFLRYQPQIQSFFYIYVFSQKKKVFLCIFHKQT